MDRACIPDIEQRLDAYSRLAQDSDPATRAQAWENIDEDLSSVNAIRLSLCSRRNDFVPVNRLPFESLSAIFRTLAEMWPLQDERRERRGLGWIQVTHVCQRWRAVACRDAALWAAAIVEFPLNEQWSLEMMTRIKSLPFRFTFSSHSNGSITPAFVQSLLDTHLHHVRHLALSITSEDSNMANIFSSLSSAAPHLETVTLRTDSGDDRFLLPLDALCDHTPALRSISLGGIMPRWDSHMFYNSNLVELKISMRNPTMPMNDPRRSSALALASVLSHLPNLRVLLLGACLPLPTDDFRPFASIRLSKLSHLNIEGTTAECTAIIEALSLPPACTVDVYCCVQLLENSHHLIPLFMRVGAHLHSDSHLPPIQTFSVETGSRLTLSLAGWRGLHKGTMGLLGPTAPDSASAAFTMDLQFECATGAALRNIYALWNMVHTSLPLQETRYLTIHISHVFDNDVPAEAWIWNWVDQLAPFTAVTHCRISTLILEHSPALFSALKRTTSHRPLQLLLPSLKSLCLSSKHKLDFGIIDDEELQDYNALRARWVECRNTLFETMKQRKESRFGIEKLILEDWIISARFKGRFRSVVPNVTLTKYRSKKSILSGESSSQ